MKYFSAILMLMIHVQLFAQIRLEVYLDLELEKTYDMADTFMVHPQVIEIQNGLLLQGYIYHGIDSLIRSERLWKIYIQRGSKEKIKVHKVIEGADTIMDKIKARPLSSIIQSQLQLCQNAGYPYVSLKVDTLEFSKDEQTAIIILDRGPKITYDSLQFSRDIKHKKSYVSRALGTPVNGLYQEKRFKDIETSIGRIQTIELKSDPTVSFSEGQARIYLDVEDRKVNSLEGLVGLQSDGSNNASLAGFIKLDLFNISQSGKSFHLDWNRFQSQSQHVKINYFDPYLFQSRFSFDPGINLFKQDTTFSKRTFSLDLGFDLSTSQRFQIGVERTTSDFLAEGGGLEYLDYSLTGYRAGIQWHLPVLRASNQTYWWANLSASLGQKKITNAARQLFDEDTINASSTNVDYEFSVVIQNSLNRHWALYNNLESGYLHNRQLTLNEFYRLGGMNSIRGFNENFFFAQYYTLSRNEVRYYFEEHSFFHGFFDLGFISNEFSNFSQRWPFGFGAGMSLDTGNGQFNFIFAMGHVRGSSASFAEAKIHLGYRAMF